MRRRICKGCGAEFQGSKSQRMCPVCRKAARRDTVIRPRVCIVCGITFDGGPRARYCPTCRIEREKEWKRDYLQRKAHNKTRPIGSTDICQVCGKEYTVNSGLQKYCPDCAEEAIRAKVLPQKIAYAAHHAEERASRNKELKEQGTVCAYCGKAFTATTPSVTCSEACELEYNRIVMGRADYKRGRRKTEPTHDRRSSGLPQSDVTGVSYIRRSGKWQVKNKGKYIGVFASKEEAEAKAKELRSPE